MREARCRLALGSGVLTLSVSLEQGVAELAEPLALAATDLLLFEGLELSTTSLTLAAF